MANLGQPFRRSVLRCFSSKGIRHLVSVLVFVQLFCTAQASSSCKNHKSRTGVIQLRVGTGIVISGAVDQSQLNVLKLTRTVTYQKLITCPNVANIKDAVIMSHAYRCPGGSGKAGCGKEFGGFSDSERALMTDETYFVRDESGGTGSCMQVWDVEHCHAITPVRTVKEMSVLKVLSTTCSLYLQDKGDEPISSVTLKTLRVNLLVKCPQANIRYALAADGRLYVNSESRAQGYADNRCPIYKIEGKEWEVNRPSWVVHRDTFDGYSVMVDWSGTVSGDSHSINGLTVEEDIEEALVEYETEELSSSCTDSVLYTTLIGVNCTIASVQYLNHAHSVISGKFTGQVRIKVQTASKLGCAIWISGRKVIVNQKISDIDSGKVLGKTYICSSNCKMLEIPLPDVELNYGHNMEDYSKSYGQQGTFGVDFGDILDGYLGFYKGMIKFIPLVVLVTLMVLNLSFFMTPMGTLVGLVSVLAFMFSSVEGVQMSQTEKHITCAHFLISVSGALSSYFPYKLFILLISLVFNYCDCRKHQLLSYTLIIIGNLTIMMELPQMLVFIVWMPIVFRHQKVLYERMNGIENEWVENMSKAFATLRPWTTFYDGFSSGFCLLKSGKTIVRRHSKGLMIQLMSRLVIREFGVAEMCRDRSVPKGKRIGLRNLCGINFFPQEFGLVRPILEVMDRDDWTYMVKNGPYITQRELWSLDWFKEFIGKYENTLKKRGINHRIDDMIIDRLKNV
uniref:Glycoprotein n=1 Tax=Jingmen tick virus TaxID=1172985 RepID=A0A7S9PR58_9FLAV|nr:glycoprotein [Jingmen tick virus]